MTILLSNKGTQYEKTIDCAATLMARDYKGFGNQAMTAVVEVSGGADGVLLGKTPNFQRGPLKDTARTIMTDGMNGVVEWKK